VRRDLDHRLAALVRAIELADGRLDEEAIAPARGVVKRAGERLGLDLEATVAALAGPTGAGKSTLFNALAGAELAHTSRRRPTTSAPTAAIWGEAPDALLDWLEVPLRHVVGDGTLSGLVLLDLPDFDSVDESHRLEVDRLVELVDLLVWVVDPQKYADAALHERYLRPLARHAGSMAVVLNQSDVLSADALRACRADLVRVLAEDGLEDVPVLAASATTGDGVRAVTELLKERVARREAALERLSADVASAVPALSRHCGAEVEASVGRDERARLLAALAEAAGVPTVVSAVARAHRRRGALATGWPFVRWLRRFRPDPLRRLRLPDRPDEATHTSLPRPSPVQRAGVDSALRELGAGAGAALSGPWPGVVRSAATAREDELADRLDRAVAGADLRMRRPRWWRLAGVLQVLLALVAVAGAVWLAVLAVLGYLQLAEAVPTPRVDDVPVPTMLLVGGAAAGVVLAVLARMVNGLGARRRARGAARSLRARIEAVVSELVVEPVEAELRAHGELCAALEQAGGSGGLRRRLKALAPA